MGSAHGSCLDKTNELRTDGAHTVGYANRVMEDRIRGVDVERVLWGMSDGFNFCFRCTYFGRRAGVHLIS